MFFRPLIFASFLFMLSPATFASASSCLQLFSEKPVKSAMAEATLLLQLQATDVLARMKIDMALIEAHARSGFRFLDQNQVWQIKKRYKYFHDFNLNIEVSHLPYPFVVKFSGVHAKYAQSVLQTRIFDQAARLGLNLTPPHLLELKKPIETTQHWMQLTQSLEKLNSLHQKLDRMKAIGEEKLFTGHGLWLNRHELQQLPRLLADSLGSLNQLARSALEKHAAQEFSYESILYLFTRQQSLLDSPELRSYRRAFTWTVIGSDRKGISEVRKQLAEFRKIQSIFAAKIELAH